MSAIARGLARALLAIAAMLLLTGIIVAGIGVYLAAWPVRRAARRSPSIARAIAVRDVLFALAGLAAVRGRSPLE